MVDDLRAALEQAAAAQTVLSEIGLDQQQRRIIGIPALHLNRKAEGICHRAGILFHQQRAGVIDGGGADGAGVTA